MAIYSSRLGRASATVGVLLGGLLATACVAPGPRGPVAVAQSNPTVTYVYHNDAELLQANQNAAGYCAQYQAVPSAAHFADGPDGRAAVFECVQGAPMTTTTTMVTTGAPMAPTQIVYDSYYDDYYGPYYDGYWAPDGFYYFSDGPGRPYRRDDYHHFRRDMATGYHGVRSARGSVHS